MKTQNQEMIQQLMDEGEYAPSYPFVLKSNLSALEKLLVGQMLNDIRMNGTITWKHQTYADKLGSSRQVIMKLFGKLKELGILIAGKNNKQGGKSNIFQISFNAIEDYKTCNQKTQVKPETSRPQPETFNSKPETFNSKPETSRFKPETSRPQPDTETIHIKKLKENNKETNKENNKESINTGDDEIIGDNASFLSFMEGANEDKPKDELDIFLEELDI